MTSLYIRLSGPVQSWAGPKVSGNISRTNEYPTRSGLEGLIGACLGLLRGERPSWFDDLQFSVRVDSSGHLFDEFQTIGSRDEDVEFATRLYTLITRKKATKNVLAFIPDAQGKTTIVNRTLLADSEFLVRIQCEGHLEQLDTAISDPVFIPYLGRKAFSPTFPFYLGIGADSALDTLPCFDKSSITPRRKFNQQQSDTVQSPEVTVNTPTTTLAVYHLSALTTTQGFVTVPLVPSRATWLDNIAAGLQRRRGH